MDFLVKSTLSIGNGIRMVVVLTVTSKSSRRERLEPKNNAGDFLTLNVPVVRLQWKFALQMWRSLGVGVPLM
jgi:hypothetical protein